jgi:Flp pilus assembly protein TadG
MARRYLKDLFSRSIPARLAADIRGVAVVEMAIVLPVLLVILMGIVTYGSWFLTAHSVQQVANDAARASLAGVNATDRANIVNASVATSVRRGGTLSATHTSVAIDDDGATLVVHLSYDASSNPLFTASMLPLPEKVIRRDAVIRLESE